MLIIRELGRKLADLAAQFVAIAILGPRQSGKTTLSKKVFPHHHYVNFEELDMRQFATEDPKGFLDAYGEHSSGIILDEIQHVPHLLSYLQTRIDQHPRKGFYILTGSQNILLNQQISQTLAGCISLQYLSTVFF